MKFPIRGSLGVQIMSVIAAHAIAYENDATISELVLNRGEYKPEIYGMYPELHQDYDYFTKVLSFNDKFKISVVDGKDKLNAFTFDIAQLVCKHIEKIRNNIDIIVDDVEGVETALHIRYLKDKRLCSFNKFKTLKSFDDNNDIKGKHRAVVFADDYSCVSDWENLSPHKDIIKDWQTIVQSRFCMGVLSAYTFSAALLNPDLKLYLFSERCCEYSNTLPKSDWLAADYYVNNLENIRWVSV